MRRGGGGIARGQQAQLQAHHVSCGVLCSVGPLLRYRYFIPAGVRRTCTHAVPRVVNQPPRGEHARHVSQTKPKQTTLYMYCLRGRACMSCTLFSRLAASGTTDGSSVVSTLASSAALRGQGTASELRLGRHKRHCAALTHLSDVGEMNPAGALE